MVRTSLRMSTSWRLPSPRWSELEAVLGKLSTALADGDAEVFGRACAVLIDLAPKRATPLGDEPLLPAPETVRERINEMVHRLVDAAVPDRDRAVSEGGSAASGERCQR
jgi:hypothetical protein